MSGAGTQLSPYFFNAVNGAVTINVNSNGTTTGTDTIYAEFLVQGSCNSRNMGKYNSKYCCTTPASIGFVNAPSTIDTSVYYNGGTEFPLTLDVLDQSGNPVAQGAIKGTISITGAAVSFASQLTTDSFTMNSGTTTLDIVANSKTSTGTITVTANVPNFGTASTTLTCIASGDASQVVLGTQPTTTSFTADTVSGTSKDSALISYAVKSEDANGIAITGGKSILQAKSHS